MTFLDLAKKRCSTRKYQDKAVEKEKISRILEAGNAAPTAANKQPVKIFAVTSVAGKKKLRKGVNFFGAPMAFLICADHQKAWTRPFDQKRTMDIDASIVTDHMMLEATDQGLASVWICYFKPDVICEELALPETLEPINVLAVGYGAEPLKSPDRHKKDRLGVDQLTTYI